jgi:hypothetical protein
MRIPVFVSCPTTLSARQEAARKRILGQLERLALEPRALGRSDYPTEYPLREVAVIAKHCSGGVILGFEQFRAPSGVWKRGAKEESKTAKPVLFPTSWNHLEAGILFGLKLPLLVFREEGITGGVFDNGVTDAFVHTMPDGALSAAKREAFEALFLKWQARVREHYYRESV